MLAFPLVIALAALSAGVAVAAFSSSTANGGNSFSAGTWPWVQTGTASVPSNGATNTVTVPISSVTTSKAFLIFQTRHSGDRPVSSQVRGRIASPTSLEFVRVSDEGAPGSPIDVRWSVVEHPRVNVQRGQTTLANSTTNQAITPVAALNQAFVTWSKTSMATDVIYSENDPSLAELTTTSNLQFRHSPPDSGGHVAWWQVIEFTNPADVNVQKGTTSLIGAATSTTAGLGTPVNVNKTFVLASYLSPDGSDDVGAKMLRATLTDSTTITFDRAVSNGSDIPEIAWQAIELKDTSTVQGGSQSFAPGTAQRTTPISSVVTNRSVAFASVQPVGGQNMGITPYIANDVIGVCSVTMVLAANQITMDRNSTLDTCDVGWFVVEFGL